MAKYKTVAKQSLILLLSLQQKTRTVLQQIQDILARDHYLTKDARGIARQSCWETLEGNGKVLWGQYRTKRSRFASYVDLRYEKPAFRCNCKSRKTPCKHSLALLLLLTEQSDNFRVTDEFPEEFQTWLKRRDGRLQPKARSAEEEAKLADVRQKNWEKRLTQMSKGLHDLELWLQEVIQEGLAGLHKRAPAYWEEWGAALVNAKLGSLAKRVKALPRFFLQEDWHEDLLAELGDIYLLVKGFQNIDTLPIDLQQELFNTLGVNVKKEEVLQSEAVKDKWWVLAKHEGAEDNLSFQRTWLLGEDTERYALLLDFAWGGQGFPHHWQPGTTLEAALCFYPANFPQRALIKDGQVVHRPFEADSFPDFITFNRAYRSAIAKNPWLNLFPVCLGQVRPFIAQDELYLSDLNDLHLPCKSLKEQLAWQLIALSAGKPIQVFGEWNGTHFLPLSALAEGRFIDFSIHHEPTRRTWYR